MKTDFSTPEISLAAALLSLGYKHLYVTRDKESHRFFFVFESTEQLQPVVQSWWQRSLIGNLNNYAESLRFLKAKLRNDSTGQNKTITE